MDPLSLLKYTVSGLMPLVVTSLTGALLAQKKILTHPTINKITASYSNFFCPVFIFVSIAGSVSFSQIKILWPLLFTPSLMVIVGSIVSFAHSKIFKQVPHLSRIVATLITFSNIGNLPLVLMKGICSPYGPLDGNQYCSEASSYVSLQLLTYAAIIWSYGYALIERDKRDYQIYLEEQELLHEGKQLKQSPPFSMWSSVCKHLLLPVPLACISGLAAGLIPEIKETYYEKESKTYALVDSLLTLGMAGVILGQMSLGANLYLLSSSNKEITKKYIASVVLFKNIIMPLVALGIIYGFWQSGIFGDNIVMLYVVFISFCCPTALVIMIITQALDYGTKEVVLLMFWIYCSSILTMMVSTYVFFTIFIIV